MFFLFVYIIIILECAIAFFKKMFLFLLYKKLHITTKVISERGVEQREMFFWALQRMNWMATGKIKMHFFPFLPNKPTYLYFFLFWYFCPWKSFVYIFSGMSDGNVYTKNNSMFSYSFWGCWVLVLILKKEKWGKCNEERRRFSVRSV